MKIKVTWTPTGSAQPTGFTLCDTTAAPNGALNPNGLRNLMVNGEQIIQEALFFRAAARTYYARGNEKTVVGFEVSYTWPDNVTAEQWVMFYNTNYPRIAAVSFQSITPQKGKTAYFTTAAILPAESKLLGQTTFHTHRINGGIMSATLS